MLNSKIIGLMVVVLGHILSACYIKICNGSNETSCWRLHSSLRSWRHTCSAFVIIMHRGKSFATTNMASMAARGGRGMPLTSLNCCYYKQRYYKRVFLRQVWLIWGGVKLSTLQSVNWSTAILLFSLKQRCSSHLWPVKVLYMTSHHRTHRVPRAC